MGVYHCGVEGPLSLEDGRIVTSAEPFELEVDNPHDEHLVASGQIVLVEEDPAAPAATTAAPAAAQKPAAAAQATTGEAK